MTEFHKWFEEHRVERTIRAFRKKRFDAHFVPKASDAPGEILQRIPAGASVGIGGSPSLAEGESGFRGHKPVLCLNQANGVKSGLTKSSP